MKTGMCALIAGLLMPLNRLCRTECGQGVGRHGTGRLTHTSRSLSEWRPLRSSVWPNARLHLDGRPQLYCEPKMLALTSEQDISILRRYVKEHPETKDKPAGVVMLLAMQDIFPCKGQ
jgi:Rap1a immunity proteins